MRGLRSESELHFRRLCSNPYFGRVHDCVIIGDDDDDDDDYDDYDDDDDDKSFSSASNHWNNQTKQGYIAVRTAVRLFSAATLQACSLNGRGAVHAR